MGIVTGYLSQLVSSGIKLLVGGLRLALAILCLFKTLTQPRQTEAAQYNRRCSSGFC